MHGHAHDQNIPNQIEKAGSACVEETNEEENKHVSQTFLGRTVYSPKFSLYIDFSYRLYLDMWDQTK